MEIINVTPKKNQRTLVVGQVQSGKTKYIIDQIKESLKNKTYKVIILFGGINNILTDQAYSRVLNDMKNNGNVKICSGQRREIVNDFNNIHQYIKTYGLTLYILMKEKSYIKELERIDIKKSPCLVIDDESDYGSADKDNSNLKIINKSINDFLSYNKADYLLITATPFANIKEDIQHEKLNNLFLLEPGNGYTGSSYFISQQRYIKINSSKNEKNTWKNAIFEAVR
jgi:hypothetical protein